MSEHIEQKKKITGAWQSRTVKEKQQIKPDMRFQDKMTKNAHLQMHSKTDSHNCKIR